jgi:hypothetical protein
MNGGIMLKRLRVGSLVSLFLAFPLAVGLLAGWNGSVPSWGFGQDDQDWRRRQMQFFQAAYDRLDLQLRERPGGAGAQSLRREQQAILRLMAETAQSPMSGDIPSDTRVPTQSAAMASPSDRRGAVPAEPHELLVGLGSSIDAGLDLSILARDPALSQPIERAARRHRKDPHPASEHRESRDAGVPATPNRAASKGEMGTLTVRTAKE